MYAQFDVQVPTTLVEALDALTAAGTDSDCLPLCGGTNVLVDLRARTVSPEVLVSLSKVSALRQISVQDGQVRLGGTTTVSDILRHPDMARLGGSLVGAARVFAGQMVRNTATVAGNICCGSPAADLVPPLLALDAVLTLESSRGRREVPLAEFYTGYKTSLRQRDELVTQVSWPIPGDDTAHRFHKLGRRKGDAITVVGVAVALTVKQGLCTRARIALGAVAPVVKRAVEAETLLEGQSLTPVLIEAAAQAAVETASPIDDVRASANYRRHGVLVLTRRLLGEAWERLS